MGTLHQIRNEDNRNDSSSLAMALRVALRRVVDVEIGFGASFEEREVATLKVANAATRANLEADLQAIADAHSKELLVNGVLYRAHEVGSATYHSLSGALFVTRATYRKAASKDRQTVVPLELQAGIVERATPALGKCIGLGYAKGHMRGLEEDLHASHRLPPSRSTLERMAMSIGTRAHREAVRIEAHVRRGEAIPVGACAMSLGLDRTAVPMEELRAEDAAPTTPRKKRVTPYVREQPPAVDVHYRMAYVGTVSFLDANADVLVTRRYVASAKEGPVYILHRMLLDVRHARTTSTTMLPILVVQDGAPELWNIMRSGLEAEKVGAWHEAIDRFHLMEHLAAALSLIEDNPAERKLKLAAWSRELDADDGAIDRIRAFFSDVQIELSESQTEKLDKERTYLENNHDRMRYATLRAKGLPVGSGATEGACKSVVNVRAKRSGQRWHDEGLTASLTLRAIYLSERLHAFWTHLAASYRAEIGPKPAAA